MIDPEPLFRFWRTLDGVFARVQPFRWGAVVTDPRFPLIREANYARVETAEPGLELSEVESALLPALTESGADRAHLVLFHPEQLTDLVAEASMSGERINWDLAMEFRGRADACGRADARDDDLAAEVTRFGARFWRGHRASARHFGIDDGDALDQLQRIERDLLLPIGKRWFTVRERGRTVAYASLLVLEGVGWIDHVVTFPGSRRRGYATALTRRILSEAHTAGAERTYLLAEPDGAAALLYRKLGFRPVTHIASWIAPLRRA